MENGWKKLNLEKPPEDAYIYCNICGLKNRGDINWVYKDDPEDPDVKRVKNELEMLFLKGVIYHSMFEFSGFPAKNYYLCDDCRKKAGVKLRIRKKKELLKK